MALFSALSEKIADIFSKLTKRGKLTELDVKEAMREVKVALLEADVNFLVVKNFIASVTEKAVGEKVTESLTPGQQVIKIVNEELVALMGGTNSKLEFSSKPPSVFLMCGLQGAGKTSMCGKLAVYLKKQGKKPLLVACDIYRPAAIEQLKVVAKQADTPVFEKGTQKPQKTVKEAVDYAIKFGYDVVVIDTAGRLQIDETLMDELKQIKDITNPAEILLTVDAMTGQEAVNVAESFNKQLGVTGLVLTKLDGDTRGGAALSMKAVTGKPIKFCGVGEKVGDLEIFYPDRMASRILGMGDVMSLIEKAQEAVTEKEALEMERKFRENSFDLNDYLTQFESVKKMGGISSLLGMIPGMGQLKNVQVDEAQLKKNKSIILSMTPSERENPDSIRSSNRRRVATGSGTSVQDVNALLKQFEQAKQMMKQLKNFKGKGMKLPF